MKSQGTDEPLYDGDVGRRVIRVRNPHFEARSLFSSQIPHRPNQLLAIAFPSEIWPNKYLFDFDALIAFDCECPSDSFVFRTYVLMAMKQTPAMLRNSPSTFPGASRWFQGHLAPH